MMIAVLTGTHPSHSTIHEVGTRRQPPTDLTDVGETSTRPATNRDPIRRTILNTAHTPIHTGNARQYANVLCGRYLHIHHAAYRLSTVRTILEHEELK